VPALLVVLMQAYHDRMSGSPMNSDRRPFQVSLDFASGSLTPFSGSMVRKLSDMAGSYEDQEAVRRALGAGEDPVIYSAYDADVPDQSGELLFRTTVIAPGVIGSEYYMTRGHHHVKDSAELYLGMSGRGVMVMESRSGEFAHEELVPSAAVYVPPGWAHRTVNTGDVPLAFLAIYFGDAGHDYGSMEKGFAHRLHRGASGAEFRPPLGTGERK
jgi:glucose-6-phosphate isomerase, archaeal